MKIVIENIKWEHRAFTDVSQLKSLLLARLNAHKIQTNITTSAGTITFSPTKTEGAYKKLFISAIENKIVLNETDPRIKKLGRNFLVSLRLTKEQTDVVEPEILHGVFNDLNLSADIKYFEHDDPTSFIMLRQSKEIRSTLPKPTSYPVAGDK